MRLELHGAQIPAVVRGKRLHRHRALVDEGRRCAAVLIAQGPPRAWQRSLEAAVLGVAEATGEEAVDAESLLASAARRVRAASDALVDDGVVQVHGVAITVDEEGLAEIASAGSCRAYLDRRGEHRRVSSKTHSKGLADAFTFPKKSERLEPADVVILGPSHLFGVAGVAALARILQRSGEDPEPQQVVRGLLSLCRTQETGGAAVALKVR